MRREKARRSEFSKGAISSALGSGVTLRNGKTMREVRKNALTPDHEYNAAHSM
jgi:hypothetical protein